MENCSSNFRINFHYRISLFLLPVSVFVDGITIGKIIAPSTYTALTNDLQVEFQTSEILPLAFLSLQVSYMGTTHFRNIGQRNFYTDDQSNSTKFEVPCSLFTRAGPYTLHVVRKDRNESFVTSENHQLEHKLDVRWPNSKLSVTHEIIETYPTDPVSAVIEFMDFECPVDTKQFEDVPSFQLELTYCGLYNIMCDSRSVAPNSTFPIQVIYGMQRSRVIPLSCEFFGLAGNYVLHLKPLPPLDSSLAAQAFIKVTSDFTCWASFSFLSFGRKSIYPPNWIVLWAKKTSFVPHADNILLFLLSMASGWLE